MQLWEVPHWRTISPTMRWLIRRSPHARFAPGPVRTMSRRPVAANHLGAGYWNFGWNSHLMMRCLSRLVEAHRPVLIVVVADFLIWNVSYFSATITATA